MEKTADEVLCALEACGDLYGDCENCPYTGKANCVVLMAKDAADTIRLLRENASVAHPLRAGKGA